ncbi:MAG: gamma-glutamyltransferase family protein [Burkholderiaceae bacterium]|nr:gamma-glutamyltransferase family protein [Burkholderiaceae bacterium]MBP6817369.1 gamma-glutamyltransferase family protein [Burkholderiaceae bacterium]MBP7661794.1 gamma-glutamyltransferase family protein [Burkholderiaceae bacterium]
MTATPYAFDWKARYPTYRSPVFARNVVATSQPLAAQAGLRMLAAGGSAVDAAIAAAATLTIVEPVSNGLGSDAFAILWDGSQLHGLNASGTAPAAWDTAYFNRKHGGKYPVRGWDTVTVPGAISAWAALHEKFGKLPFADLLAPAIELAERGHGVAGIVQQKWASQVPELSSQPGFAQAFMPRGRAPAVGERFVFADAGRTLRRIAETRGRDFYEGQTAQALVAHARENGGSMSLADLAGYRPDWCGTIQKDYRGFTLHEIPPNGQGIAALMALGILSNFDMAQYPPDSVETRHLQIEAMKAAFADVYRYVADIRHMTDVTPAHLLDDAYLAQRARRISMDRATDFAHGMPPSGGTIYLTAADASGMMISFIQSNYMGFGSGVVVPGVGVSLQNRGYCFSLDESHPNCVAPGKRPFQTIIPAFLMKDGAPQMSYGVMGGNMQPQGHMQTLTRMLDHRQNPQAACDAPRWKVQRGLRVDIESTMEPAVIEALRQRGHEIEMTTDSYMDFGSGQFIWRLTDDMEDGYAAASDSRRDGHAAAF